MPKVAPIRSSFNAGELSPLLDGRVDVAKYQSGCTILENFIPAVQGPAVRRPGTKFVAEVKNSANRTWLHKFEFSNTQAYVLEFGDGYVRFFTQNGSLQFAAPSAWSAVTAYTIGDLVSYSGANYYCKVANTNVLPTNTGFWHALTGTTYEVPSPYSAADLITADGTFGLSVAQTGDIIYIAHPSYAPRKLVRYSNTRWTLEQVNLKNGPFKTENTTKTTTVYASANTGTVTLTASSAVFSAAMVGSLFYMEPADLSSVKPWLPGQEFKHPTSPFGEKRRSDGKTYSCATTGAATTGKVWRTGGDKPIHTYGTQADGDYNAKDGTNIEREGLDWTYVDSGYGILKIVTYTSATSVTATVQTDWTLPAGVVGAGNATWRWALASFSGVEGYPSKVSLFRERLTFAKGQTLYFSCSGDYENFAATDDSGLIVDDRAIQATISSDTVNPIQWLASTQALLIGTSSAEFSCAENATSEPFAPGNVKIEQQSGEGSRSVEPSKVGSSVLMTQASGRRLHEVAYSFNQNGWSTADLTVLSEHVTKSGVIDTDWHRSPYKVLWAVRADGLLLGFTFNKEQDVVGWHRHPVGGSFSGGAAVVETVACIPAYDRTRDELWMITKRTINGQTKRYVEYLSEEFESGDVQADAFYVDCGATYSGSPATVISGLSYLEGQTVAVLADGAAHPDEVVTGGSITLEIAASKVHVGLPYVSTLQTTRIDAGGGDGTAQGKTKRIAKVAVRLHNTLGGYVGPDADNLDEMLFRDPSVPMGSPPSLYSGDVIMDFPGDYDLDGRIMIRQTQPFPMTVVALVPFMTTYDR